MTTPLLSRRLSGATRRPLLALLAFLGFLFSAAVNAAAMALLVGALRPEFPSEAAAVVRTLMEGEEKVIPSLLPPDEPAEPDGSPVPPPLRIVSLSP